MQGFHFILEKYNCVRGYLLHNKIILLDFGVFKILYHFLDSLSVVFWYRNEETYTHHLLSSPPLQLMV